MQKLISHIINCFVLLRCCILCLKALVQEVVRTIRDIIQLNPLYRESVQSVMVKILLQPKRRRF